jgi:putative PIN family toxin of toxin-antitoxin system
MRVERVVLDTNVLISAAFSPHVKPFACLRWVLDDATLIVLRELLEELETRLTRPKFNKYIDDPRRRAFVADLGLSANDRCYLVREDFHVYGLSGAKSDHGWADQSCELF